MHDDSACHFAWSSKGFRDRLRSEKLLTFLAFIFCVFFVVAAGELSFRLIDSGYFFKEFLFETNLKAKCSKELLNGQASYIRCQNETVLNSYKLYLEANDYYRREVAFFPFGDSVTFAQYSFLMLGILVSAIAKRYNFLLSLVFLICIAQINYLIVRYCYCRFSFWCWLPCSSQMRRLNACLLLVLVFTLLFLALINAQLIISLFNPMTGRTLAILSSV